MTESLAERPPTAQYQGKDYHVWCDSKSATPRYLIDIDSDDQRSVVWDGSRWRVLEPKTKPF